MNQADVRKELQAEYAMLQGHYEAFDQRALTLKGFATPLLGAGLATGFQQASWMVLAVTVAAALALWTLEVIWKSFQYCHQPRLRLLEAWFRREGPPEIKPFQIDAAWSAAWAAGWQGRVAPQLRVAAQPFVALPSALVVAAVLAGAGWLEVRA